jgi:tetratricopeptide (TPR) repeat protein
MFGLFSRNSDKPSVTPEDKAWVEQSLTWLIETFGFEGVREQPFIFPTVENFPYKNVKDSDQFGKLFIQICQYWHLNPDDIEVRFFDDIKSKQWSAFRPGKIDDPAGLYYKTGEKQPFKIHLAKSNQDNVQLLIAVIAHELSHVKLLGGNLVSNDAPDLEPLTDLASIYFGFGIFMANSYQTKDANWMQRTGYLPDPVISYANALLCYLAGKKAKEIVPYLNTNTRALFEQDLEFLESTNDTPLTREKLKNLDDIYQISGKIDEAFSNRNFGQAMDASNELLQKKGKDIIAFNNLGYALLQLKRYTEAIDAFTQAVDINPHWDYPFNNRGYCKLQLSDLESAYADLYTSFEMNPDNSFSWRNMGAYYLKVNDCEKALHHFQEAEKRDPQTEMINFYLAQAYRCLGNPEKADHYLSRSKEINEHNDSTIL